MRRTGVDAGGEGPSVHLVRVNLGLLPCIWSSIDESESASLAHCAARAHGQWIVHTNRESDAY